MQSLVNISSLVINSEIHTEVIEGVEFTVIPSKTLPKDVVMNSILYPSEEVEAAINTLDGSPVTLSHPIVSGRFADAYAPLAQALYGLGGAFNRVKGQTDDGRWIVEKLIPTEQLHNTERGKKLAEAIKGKKPIHTSTGVYLTREPEIGTNAAGQEYQYRAKIDKFNHDAILLNEIGAATPEQGVGIFVNADGEQEVEVMYCNLSSGEDFSLSSNQIRRKLEKAADEACLFSSLSEKGEDDVYCEIDDYNEDTAIFYTRFGLYSVKYAITNGEIEFIGDIKKVETQRNYVFGGVIGKIVDIVKSVVKSTGQDEQSEIPMNNSREGKQVEKQEAEKMIADALAVNSQNIEQKIADAVASGLASALAANKAATEQAEKDSLIQQVVNAKLLPEEAAKECGIAALKAMIANHKQPAFGLNANRAAGNENADPFADYKFEG